jgi:hypothetical protein
MGLNTDAMDAARELPRDDKPDVVDHDVQATAERRPTPGELFVRGDERELRRRCAAELSPEAFKLAMSWAFAMESRTSADYIEKEYRTVARIAKHFPGLEGAVRGVYAHVTDNDRDPWPGCCTWVGDSGELDDKPGA